MLLKFTGHNLCVITQDIYFQFLSSQVVNAEGSIDEVNEQLMKVVMEKMANPSMDELGTLTWKDLRKDVSAFRLIIYYLITY